MCGVHLYRRTRLSFTLAQHSLPTFPARGFYYIAHFFIPHENQYCEETGGWSLAQVTSSQPLRTKKPQEGPACLVPVEKTGAVKEVHRCFLRFVTLGGG